MDLRLESQEIRSTCTNSKHQVNPNTNYHSTINEKVRKIRELKQQRKERASGSFTRGMSKRGLLLQLPVALHVLLLAVHHCVHAHSFNATSRNITKLPDQSVLNPYKEGCLYSYGLQREKRTCNSEDDDDESSCSSNDMKYMEIRIHTGDWESITYESWILQILLSEILHVPTTIDTGRGLPNAGASIDFYNRNADYIYGTNTLYASIISAYESKDGDCVSVIHTDTNQRIPNTTCAHVILESWRGIQSSSEIRQMVFESIVEPPQTLGVLGLETWFVTKFTLDENPQFAIYLGLQGEENRVLLAETFKRPTTWSDYCTYVSENNCTIPDDITQRSPQSFDEQVQYYNEGNYIGHFRSTEENNCTLHPTTCTGHIADFPCGWDSFVQAQTKYLNIPLKSSGPEGPIGGYTYSRLVELWRAANATKSNLIMHYWTPEPLVQEFVNTDAEFIRITMPSPSQLCADNRRPETYQCSLNETLRYGVKEGICEESTKNLYKIVVGNLFDAIYNNPKITEPIRSPAYDAIRLFQLSELQLGQIFDYFHKSTSIATNTLSSNNVPTARDAVCRWVIENLDTIHTFVPRSYPRIMRSSMPSSGITTIDSSQNIAADSSVFSIIAIILGCIATLLVVVMWYLVYKNRTLRSIRFAQVEFLYLLLAGLLLVAIGSILVGLQPSNATCVTIIWFINFGYTLEFVPLIVKVAAVNKLIGSARRFRRVVLSRKSLFTTVFAISALVFMFLLAWTIIDPPIKNDEFVLTNIVTEDGNTIVDVTHFCSSDSRIWDYVAVGWNTLLLLCATILAFQTRTLQKDFNESQTLAFLIYSHFVFVVLRLITVILQQWDGNTTSVERIVGLRSLIFSIDTIATILIYFVPKFTATANKNEPDNYSSSTMNNDISSSGRNGGKSNRQEELMSGTSESSRPAVFDSLHSSASTNTMKQSNGGCHPTDHDYLHCPVHRRVSDTTISYFSSRQSGERNPEKENDDAVDFATVTNDTSTSVAKCTTMFTGSIGDDAFVDHNNSSRDDEK